MMIKNTQTTHDLVLCGYREHALVPTTQISFHSLSPLKDTHLSFFAVPTPPDEIYNDGVELCADEILASKVEQRFSRLSRDGEATTLNESIRFMPQPLKISVLISGRKDYLDLEFGNDFPIQSVVGDHVVVPLNLLLHPSRKNEVLVRALSGTLLPHVRLEFHCMGPLVKLELSIGDYKKTRWLQEEELRPFFSKE